MKKIIEYVHHNKKVKVAEDLKGKHSNHCLCYMNCKNFKPDTKENCKIAQDVYINCVNYNIVTPVWECPDYEVEDV